MATEEIYSLFSFASGFLRFSRPVQAYAYYRHKRENLLTGRWEKFSWQQLQLRLNAELIGEISQDIQVWHFFYEWGYFYQGPEDLPVELIGEEQILAIELRFTQATPWPLPLLSNHSKTALILDERYSISYAKYLELFQQGYQHLLEGNCYQFNLAHLFTFQCRGPLRFEKFCAQLWRTSIAPLAHASFFPSWQKSIVSNSPEMLFYVTPKADKLLINSMPIKGSMALESKAKWKECWQKLQNYFDHWPHHQHKQGQAQKQLHQRCSQP